MVYTRPTLGGTHHPTTSGPLDPAIDSLVRDRGFGFVRSEDGSEIFFHHSTLPPGVFDSLTDGQEIEFDIENDPRGRGQRAGNVRLVDR
jgi:CspA family cold shock protein